MDGRWLSIATLGSSPSGTTSLVLDARRGGLVVRRVVDSRVEAAESLGHALDALAGAAHPNVVRILERGDGWFDMEAVEGKTLETKIAEPLPLGNAVRIAYGLARGVGHLHRLGLVHQDVHPGSVLLQGETPRLASLAHVRWFDQPRARVEWRALSALQRRFAAPEQAPLSVREIDARSDVYALGWILAALIARRLPAEPRSREDYVDRLERDLGPTVAATAPPELAAIVLRATHLDPKRRFPTGRALARELRELLKASCALPALAA